MKLIKYSIVLSLVGCYDPPPKLIIEARSPAKLPVESGITKPWNPAAPSLNLPADPFKFNEVVTKAIQENIAKTTEQENKSSQKNQETKNATPSFPGASAWPAQPAKKPREKGWYQVSGRPGLYAYGFLDESTDPPTITDIDYYYQFPSQ